MSRRVFLDTNGWLALLNHSEKLHEAANREWRQLVVEKVQIVTTDWILAETGNGLSRTELKDDLLSAWRFLQASPRAELVVVDWKLIERAFEIYISHEDKSWGLVDCLTFVVMRDRQMFDAFTTDRDFEQAGFNCLLQMPGFS